MIFKSAILTNAGKTFLSEALAGKEKIEWTRCGISTSNYTTPEQIKPLTSLTMFISSFALNVSAEDAICTIDTVITNAGLNSGAAARCCGIYAKTASKAEVLVAVAPVSGTATYVNAESSGVVMIQLRFQWHVDGENNVQFNIDLAGFASAAALQTTNKNVHKLYYKSQSSDGVKSFKNLWHAVARAKNGDRISVKQKNYGGFVFLPDEMLEKDLSVVDVEGQYVLLSEKIKKISSIENKLWLINTCKKEGGVYGAKAYSLDEINTTYMDLKSTYLIKQKKDGNQPVISLIAVKVKPLQEPRISQSVHLYEDLEKTISTTIKITKLMPDFFEPQINYPSQVRLNKIDSGFIIIETPTSSQPNIYRDYMKTTNQADVYKTYTSEPLHEFDSIYYKGFDSGCINVLGRRYFKIDNKICCVDEASKQIKIVDTDMVDSIQEDIRKLRFFPYFSGALVFVKENNESKKCYIYKGAENNNGNFMFSKFKRIDGLFIDDTNKDEEPSIIFDGLVACNATYEMVSRSLSGYFERSCKFEKFNLESMPLQYTTNLKPFLKKININGAEKKLALYAHRSSVVHNDYIKLNGRLEPFIHI